MIDSTSSGGTALSGGQLFALAAGQGERVRQVILPLFIVGLHIFQQAKKLGGFEEVVGRIYFFNRPMFHGVASLCSTMPVTFPGGIADDAARSRRVRRVRRWRA